MKRTNKNAAEIAYEIQKKLAKDNYVKNRNLLFDLFEKNNIEKVFVSFDGQGDDGNLDDIETLPENPYILEEPFNAYKDEQLILFPTVSIIVENCAYHILEALCGGWEDGEGSIAYVVFDVKERKVKIEQDVRYTEFRRENYEDNL